MNNLKTTLLVFLLLTILILPAGLTACGDGSANGNESNGSLDGSDSNGDGDNEDVDGNNQTLSGFYVESVLIEEEREFYSIDVSYPRVKGFPGADSLSEAIDENIHASIQLMVDDAAELEEEGIVPNLNSHFESHYGYFENQDLVSLWLTSNLYLGGTHGSYWVDAYTFNSKNGELYGFLDLFRHESGAIHILDTILRDISENPDNFFESATNTVWEYDYNFNYLIDGDILTVYFPFYDLAPYASGMTVYDFTCYDLKDSLKPEIFKAMRGQEPKENLF